MDNDSVHRDTEMNFFAESRQAFGGAVAGVKAKIPANFVTLLLVKTQRHVEVFLKGGDQFQRAQDIFAGAFFGVGEVYEKLAARAFERGTNFLDRKSVV